MCKNHYKNTLFYIKIQNVLISIQRNSNFGRRFIIETVILLICVYTSTGTDQDSHAGLPDNYFY